MAKAQRQAEELSNRIDTNKNLILQEEAKVEAYLRSSENQELQTQLQQIKVVQDQQEIDKIKFQEMLRQIDAEKEAVMGQINVASDKKYKVQADMEKLSNDLDNMAQRILEEYSLTYETCQQFRNPDFEFDYVK